MKSSTKDQTEGKFHKVKGKLKEIAGELTAIIQSWKLKLPLKR